MPFRTKKQFGQHFLRQVPKELLFPLDALESEQSLQKTSNVYILEVGPGSGVVTEAVLKQLLPFSHLRITYEVVDIDLEAIQHTRETVLKLELPKRIKVVYTHKDILSHKITGLGTQDFIYIFGSLPYNISKKVVNATKQISLEVHTATRMLPSRFVLQLEVAEDYASTPPNAAFLGTDLSLFAQTRKITRKLPQGAFYPPPKVESAILEIAWKKWNEKDTKRVKNLAKIVRQGFLAKRKVIGSVFKNRIIPEKLTPTLTHLLHMRAHELSLAEWEVVEESVS